MTITLGDKPSTSALNANNGALQLPAESANTSEGQSFGQSFGQFMTDMLHQQPVGISQDAAQALTGEVTSEILTQATADTAADGQQIAEPLAIGNDGLLLPQAGPLKEITLGPNLNVITPQTAAPDSQSLEAFARAQGLDEKAVNWLFGTPATATAAAATATATATASAAVTAAVTATTTATAAAATADAATATAATAAPNTLTAATPLAMGVPAAALTTQVDAANPHTTSANQLLTAAQALWAMTEGATTDKQTSPTATATAEETPSIQLLRMPPPAAVWMQRGIVNGGLPDAVSAQKKADISESELDLGAEWGPDLLKALFTPEGTASQGASTTGTQGTAYANFAARWDAQAANRADLSNAGNSAPTELTNAAARSESIQNLADKMGQAVGQRILSEMEKGQWHLKLQLRPATLGHIEVEMRMRSGEFDAVFTAPNATTRDLLQDGMSKLRETLSQMGMDVANIHVGNGQTGQSGGDSTPGSHSGKTAKTEENAPVAAAETTRAPLVKAPKDGLDVLV